MTPSPPVPPAAAAEWDFNTRSLHDAAIFAFEYQSRSRIRLPWCDLQLHKRYLMTKILEHVQPLASYTPFNQSYNYNLYCVNRPALLFLWWQVGLPTIYSFAFICRNMLKVYTWRIELQHIWPFPTLEFSFVKWSPFLCTYHLLVWKRKSFFLLFFFLSSLLYSF